jgi:hypothetical protein
MSYTTLLAQVHDFTVGLPPAAWILARCLAPVKDARFARAAARWASPILDGFDASRGSEFGRGGETASSTELGKMPSAVLVAQMVVFVLVLLVVLLLS